jgi:hypothetical protein
VDERREREQDLLALHLDVLRDAGASRPPFEEAFGLYRQCSMYPLHTWTTVIQRPAHAIDDLTAARACTA